MNRHRRQIFAVETPLLFGHRGLSAAAPENTLSSFGLCAEHAVPGIELDVQLCESGEMIVFHDENLERVTGYSGRVASTPYTLIRELDAGSRFSPNFSGERIPTLDEVFLTFGSQFYYDIEIKSRDRKDTGIAVMLWNLIEKYSLEHVCMVSSFNPFQVRHFRRASRDSVGTAVIYADSPKVPPWLRHGMGRYVGGCSMLKPHHPLITEEIFRRDSRRRKYPLIAWTVDDIDSARRLARMGIYGIISNDPVTLRQQLCQPFSADG
jgi:glycerophosphoryl diester phosphodiesterase